MKIKNVPNHQPELIWGEQKLTTRQPCCNHATCIYFKPPGTLNNAQLSDDSSTILGLNSLNTLADRVYGFNIK